MERERKLIVDELNTLKNMNLDTLSPKPLKWVTDFQKSEQKSNAYREAGNRVFRQKKHSGKIHLQAWKNYTFGIAYAPPKSNESALSYANRSALLIHLKKYEECLLDIDSALAVTKSYDLKVKLLCRKTECQVALKEDNQRNSCERAKYYLNKIRDVAVKKELLYKVRKAEKLLELNHSDYKGKKEIDYNDYYYVEEEAEIKYSEEYGRHLVATYDISPGNHICEEKFFVTSSNGKKNFAYCNHCLAIFWATIPCDKCAYAMYCSQECKEEAWEQYHDVECETSIAAYGYEESLIQLSIRTFIMAYKEAGSIDTLKIMINDALKTSDKKTKNYLDIEKFFTHGFRNLFSFCCPKIIVPSYVQCAVNALLNISSNKSFCQNELALDRNMELKKNENAIFIATTLLKLITIFSINAFSVVEPGLTCRKGKCMHLCKFDLCCPRGMAFSPISSLFNHSCDSNVSKFYSNDGRVFYYAVRPITRGEQFFTNYYCSYIKEHKKIRQEFLKDMYELTCECIACEEDWDTLNNLKQKIIDHRDEIPPTIAGLNLLKKHSMIVEKIRKRDHRFSIGTITKFIDDFISMMKIEPKQSFCAQSFLTVFTYMFEKRYGTVLRIPKKCNNL
ncbi:SET and MYND domain-containing protein 4 [Copidosoma floridanum]|uniref:SET and MYND domain-containing protein 4 n=1 Tax=Copidosoma floridanum TaxID=29053 RepID=UPI0006C960CA|nr:SET and MYND domain-containing protein 4 [Copidosoma floridanum]